MTTTSKPDSPEIQLKLSALCNRIGVNYRDARYVLAHGIIPEGADKKPGVANITCLVIGKRFGWPLC